MRKTLCHDPVQTVAQQRLAMLIFFVAMVTGSQSLAGSKHHVAHGLGACLGKENVGSACRKPRVQSPAVYSPSSVSQNKKTRERPQT